MLVLFTHLQLKMWIVQYNQALMQLAIHTPVIYSSNREKKLKARGWFECDHISNKGRNVAILRTSCKSWTGNAHNCIGTSPEWTKAYSKRSSNMSPPLSRGNLPSGLQPLPDVKVAITLRFLATKNSYKSLQ